MLAETVSFPVNQHVSLRLDAWGEREHPPVIFSHGGGQTRHSWKSSAKTLAKKQWYSLAYDHRGHGDSDWSPDGQYSVEIFARDQMALAQSLGQKPVLVGASLGGLSAMLAEGELSPADSNFYRAIVLVDITPRMNQQGADNVMNFMTANMEQGFASLDEVAETIAEYTGRKKRKDTSGLEKNLRFHEGRYYWHWDPAIVSMRKKRTGLADRMTTAAARIRCPVLLIRGQLSDLVTPELADEFLELVPHAEFVDVAEARHMVAGDKNDIFTDALVRFIETL